MTFKLKTLVTSIEFFVIALATIMFAGSAMAALSGDANVSDSLKKGTCLSTDNNGNCVTTADAEDKVNSTVALVINIFSWIVGVISVIMIIFGGFKYITSGGDSNKVSSAKNTILYAIIGLVIVALAQTIVIFVFDTVTTAPTTPTP